MCDECVSVSVCYMLCVNVRNTVCRCTDERTQVNKSVFSAHFRAEMLLN